MRVTNITYSSCSQCTSMEISHFEPHHLEVVL
jgi:hypothetical protein